MFNRMFLSIHYTLAYCCFYVSICCPYKNFNENLLNKDNFYQTITFQRNYIEEEKGASFGFSFWIYSHQYEQKQVLTKFKMPFIEDQKIDGNLILTVEEEEVERLLIMCQDQELVNNFYAITFDDDINLDQVFDIINMRWNFFMIIIQPLQDQMTLHYEEKKYLFSFKLKSQVITINLGGQKRVFGKYNLNSFKGSLTKLDIINYFFYSQNTYEDQKLFCIIPQQFIQSLGVYLLNKFSCPIGCLECEKDGENFISCLVRDEEFKNYEFSKGLPSPHCQLRSHNKDFYLQQHQFSICVDVEVVSPNIKLIEVPITIEFNCLFGYFHAQYNNDNFCIQCPQKTSEMIECIECLIQNNLWYLQPICKSDFFQISNLPDSSYKLQERNAENYEYFIIDETLQLIHLIGVSQFCVEEKGVKDCFLLKQNHLNKKIYVKCLSNYYQENGSCFQEDINCDYLLSKGNCKECKEGSYLYKGSCQYCENNCIACIYSDQFNSSICITCIKYFTVVKNKCWQCGLFCLECIEEYDEVRNNYFARCLMCIDDSKYFLSFDGINCIENRIQNCQYAFQAVKDNIMLSTLDYQFQRQYDLSKIEILCSRCFDFYVFVFPLKQCIKYQQKQCLFGYTLQVYNSDESEVNQFDIVFDANKLIKVSQIQCLIYTDQGSECSIIDNCLKCLFLESHQQYICVECQQGFYINRLTFKCQKCIIRFCESCYHQNKISKDFWKLYSFPFYFNFIQKTYSHSFLEFAQSQDFFNYEVVCQQCIQEVNLFNNECIYSTSLCFRDDIIENQLLCADCGLFFYDSSWTLENNQCTKCPQNCYVCKIRPNEEVESYNPYYTRYISFMRPQITEYQQQQQCFMPRNKDYQFYDSEINQFINCENYLSGCEKHIIIQKMLSCLLGSPDQEYKVINNFIDDRENVLSLAANQKVKKIILKLESLQPMRCKQQLYFIQTQIFADEIFSLKDVELEINCFHEVIWEMENTIIFENFTKITINGLIIKIQENSVKKRLEFKSLKKQYITFNNVTFSHQTLKADNFQFQFFNISGVNFFNTVFHDFNLPNDITLFSIQNDQGNKIIQFLNINFENLKFQNSSLIEIKGQGNDELIFKNTLFNRGKIKNSSFVLRNIKQIQGQVKLLNFTLQNLIIDKCSDFLSFLTFYYVLIDEFLAQNNNIIDSNIIQLGQQNFLYNFNISSCNIGSKSIFIKNGNLDLQLNHIFYFKNISYQSNIYSQLSKFILIQQISSRYSEFVLQDFRFNDNIIENLQYNVDLIQINSSIIFLEQLNNIVISEVFIMRSIGLSEFYFQNVKNLNIQHSIITQQKEYKLYGIHEYLECFKKTNQSNLYRSSLVIYLAQFVSIKNLTVNQIQSYDYPILFFLSDSLEMKQQQETLTFSSIIFENSLLVQTEHQAKSTLIFIQSNQELNIIIENSNFNSNILQVYSNDANINSAAILSINAKHSKLWINSSCFEKNIVLNAETGIFYIESNEIHIQNSTFNSNNLFIYEVIKPYLIWTVSNQQEIYLEQIQNLLKIQSLYGLGYFLTQQISVENSFFEVCQGFKAFFYITLLAEGKAQFQFLQFSSNELNELNQNFDDTFGPIIYIRSILSSTFEMIIRNIKVQQIFSNQKGGLLCLYAGKGRSNIILENINMTNVFADQGALIYFESMNDQNTIKISNIFLNFNERQLELFLAQKKFDIQKAVKLLGQSKAIIYILKANLVKISEFKLEGLFFQSVIMIQEVNNIQLISLSIQEGVSNDQVVLIIPDQASKGKIVIEDLKAFNIRFGELQIEQKDEVITFPQTIAFRCDDQFKNAPDFLNKFNYKKQQINKINISVTTSSPSKYEYGLAHLGQLNKFHQIKINNLEVQNITCKLCSNGLILINFTIIAEQNLPKQEITNIVITNSHCGHKGCINIFTSSSKSRIQKQTVLQSLEFFVQNYICQLNYATDGTCLFLENVRIIISKSTFRNNNASSSGGALYIKQSDINNQLVIENTVIQNNIALIGGGIFMDGQQELNFEKLDTVVSGNQAQYFANDVSAIPSKLLLQIGSIEDDLFQFQTLKSNNTYKLQVQRLKRLIPQYGFNSNLILFPNGMPISEYKYFDWRNRVYIPINFTLRILALTNLGMEIKNLKNSYCQIKSRIIESSDQELEILRGNFTSFSKVVFNDETQNYNLDDISIYKRQDLNDEEALELEFWCSSVFVPIYNKNYPYNLLSQHNQYFLRLQIKTYPCQMGEIINETFQQCTTCKSSEGFFQLKLNQIYCLQRDQVSTIEVQPAMLNLRVGYWRPYFDTIEVSECYNSHQNCKGGWIEGDTSCNSGNLGALCEQCDLYNIRGSGQFSLNNQYKCQKCQQSTSEYFFLILRILWIFISISISASDNFQSVNEKVEALKFQKIGFKIYFKSNSKTLLFKALINYFQIINAITTFQIDFNFLSQYPLIATNQANLPNSMDCIFSQIVGIEIHYLRAIFSLIMPFLYFSLFCQVYGALSFYKKRPLNLGFITTTLIYFYIYFSPILVGDLCYLVSYRFISGYYWISSNVTYRYDTYKHLSWVMHIAVPSLIIIILIIPAYLFRLLFTNRLQLDKKPTRQLLGFLYNEFKNEAYFWEIVKILQKFIFIFILIFYYEEIFFKGGILLILLIFYQVLSLEYQPYLTKQYNKLDYFSIQICLISISLTLGISESQKNDQFYLSLFFWITLIAINLNFTIKLIVKILLLYLIGNKKINFTLYDQFCEILRLIPFVFNLEIFQEIEKKYQQRQIRKNYLFSILKQHLKQQGKLRFKNI